MACSGAPSTANKMRRSQPPYPQPYFVFKKRAKLFKFLSYLAMALGESENFLRNSIGHGGPEKRSSISGFFFRFG